jgi:alanine racemase
LRSQAPLSGPPFATRPTRAIVDLGALSNNWRLLRSRVAPRPIYAVVKADAYGHGAVSVARRLAAEEADRFAVATLEEGIALRRAGVRGEILVLGFSDPADAPLHQAFALTPTLYEAGQARAFAEAADKLPAPLPVQLKIDTGMGRLGIGSEDVETVALLFAPSRRLRLTGTFTNFASADRPDSPETAAQIESLSACVRRLRDAGVSPGLVHLANSAGVLAHPASWEDAVRPGIALYGLSPSEAIAAEGLVPVLSLETRVMAVARLPRGTPLGYGGHFITARPSTIAVLPIGYHDGYRRALSGKGSVLLRGREVPVVGAISMDLTQVDATDSGAERGDRVVCLGSDGERRITAWDLARAAETIPYEILCGIAARVPRVPTGG